MKTIGQKLKRSAGLSLAETLLTVLILLLVSGVVATGMPAAVKAYRNAIDAANAQVVLSATVNALRSELSTARDVKVDGTTITYTDADTGSRSRIYIGTDGKGNKKIMRQEYEVDSDLDFLSGMDALQPDPHPLLPDAVAKTTMDGKSLMTVTYTTLDPPAGGVLTIPGLSVKRGESTLAEMPETGLKIRVLTGGAGA